MLCKSLYGIGSKNLKKTYLIRMIEEIAKNIIEELEIKEFHSLIADGTGFGYVETYHLRWKKKQGAQTGEFTHKN